ncbi:histidinol dehydrogenase [Psychrobacillus psychrodurans]|uniref:histidinol dehydrogenase n=1 Tax=Psychrobacillus psychrodurans TaxID=126157 RepID=UPI0008EBF313|nr:histidinol dehydrogenase [Psychrobacillus psychrodurans]MCZ8540242.1 histidinol dehydrogenase [Psychrobacillus psychrodurans]SFM62326.1 histidinol dehydrogenase [Psychrobacillus psychrodurans]
MKIEKLTDTISLLRSVEQPDPDYLITVREVIADVRQNGDEALLRYTEKWDGAKLESLKVSKEEVDEAYAKFDKQLIGDLEEAAANIRAFHTEQARSQIDFPLAKNSYIQYKISPLDAVGLYVPGGTAAYPSSVLMNAIPAIVAGVERVVIVSPPNMEGNLPDSVLVAARIAGITEIYKVGGAQAIAALAYGTETIIAVDKITGPGNSFVALAKREVFGRVAIDMIAGPSEIAIIADDTAYADELAADLLAQAEHDRFASSVLITTSTSLAEQVSIEVEKQLKLLPREDIARSSIENFGCIYIAESMEQAVAAVNELAPEHLEIITEKPEELSKKIKHAGAIFIGRFSSEPVGDYFAGTNHVLPTNSTARFSSGLCVDDFVKKTSVVFYSKEMWEEQYPKIARLARLEHLEGHARSVESRSWKKEDSK